MMKGNHKFSQVKKGISRVTAVSIMPLQPVLSPLATGFVLMGGVLASLGQKDTHPEGNMEINRTE
jgi:hypothetical protein